MTTLYTNWSLCITFTMIYYIRQEQFCKIKFLIRKANNLEECVLFGFSGNDNLTQVLNYCMIYTKYYIYIQRLFDNNNLELYTYLSLLKYNLNIEYEICKNNNRADKFERFLFIHDKL